MKHSSRLANRHPTPKHGPADQLGMHQAEEAVRRATRYKGLNKDLIQMDLTTTYMGLTLKNPIVPSASPLSYRVEGIKRLEDAGAAAVVMFSLFAEQIQQAFHVLDRHLPRDIHRYDTALDEVSDWQSHQGGPDDYLELIQRAKSGVSIPIIASLNGVAAGAWVQYARGMEQAGADGLEINLYDLPTHPDLSGEQIEQRYLNLLCEVKRTVRLPIAMKLSPFLTAPANLAKRLAQGGASALVLFNRLYQDDLDDLGDLEDLNGPDKLAPESRHPAPHLRLSRAEEIGIPLRWLTLLKGHVPIDLALSTGVHTYQDVLKGLIAGANVTMMASALMQNGLGRINQILRELQQWLEAHGYQSVQQLRNQRHQAAPATLEDSPRASYMKALMTWPNVAAEPMLSLHER